MSNVLLIHGAWGGAWVFDDVARDLARRGHRVSAIDLPGHGTLPAPISDVTRDAYVGRVVEQIGSMDGPVVLVGHSLAGAAISQVAEELPERIERLVYISAFLPRNGETPLGLMESDEDGEILSSVVFAEDNSYATLGEEDVRRLFLHDVGDAARVEQLAPRFAAVEQAVATFTAPAKLTREAFGSVGKIYIRCSLDRVLSPSLQARLVTAWELERVFTLESGHFPQLSVPERLAELLSEVASISIPSI